MLTNAVKREFSGFSNVLGGKCACYRPEKLSQVSKLVSACAEQGVSVTARGAGYTYGDAAFAEEENVAIDFSRLNRIHAANWETGELIVEPGMTFRDLVSVAGPRGWLPPVTPGLSEITLGGALAMDIHGKNHRRAGGFSSCVVSVDLRLASGELIRCSREDNSDIFHAIIGGLGLVGIFERLQLQLAPSDGASVKTSVYRTDGVDATFEMLEHHAEAQSVVYWGDLLNAKSIDEVRGAVIVTERAESNPKIKSEDWRRINSAPLHLATPFYNSFTNKVFNRMYAARLRSIASPHETDLRAHLFTWDKLSTWNFLYGRRGFFEYQFALPNKERAKIKEILTTIASQAQPYLFAAKLLKSGEGFLSYGIENGISVLIDMPATQRARRVLDDADQIVASAGGRIHLAKDSRISAAAFRNIYGIDAENFKNIIRKFDPEGVFASAMTARLGLTGQGHE